MTSSTDVAESDLPLVSIIINNYNYSQFVGAAIESALNQNYPKVEVIVVDDGSTDDSRTVIESFGSRVAKIYKPNGGQGSAYNIGFAASKGDLVHFLDADDMLLPDAMKEVASSWKSDISKLHFYLLVLEGSGSVPTDMRVPASNLTNGDVRSILLSSGVYDTPPSSGNTYARFALDEILPMPEPQWRTAADLYCIFRTAFLGKVRAINCHLGLYRRHGSNMDAQAQISGKLIRYRLSLETRRDQLLFETAPKYGYSYPLGSVSKDFDHLKLRLASLLIEKEAHPFPEDTISSLTKRSLKAALSKRSFSMPKKLLFSIWVVALVLTPKPLLPKMLDQVFTPSKFSKMLRKAIRPFNP
jgi:glycosyltransferase involved in cell wall biosynthesis